MRMQGLGWVTNTISPSGGENGTVDAARYACSNYIYSLVLIVAVVEELQSVLSLLRSRLPVGYVKYEHCFFQEGSPRLSIEGKLDECRSGLIDQEPGTR